MDPFASVPADRPLDELFREPFDEPFDDFSDDPFHRIFGTPDVTEADGYYPSVLRDGKQSLGLGENYVPGWRPPHAIREYHQNWKDGIKEANRLNNREFTILDKGFDSKNVYTIEARHPDTDKLLGFISWNNGMAQYSNFGAELNRSCLNMGVSSKRHNHDLAGTHGEGFKVASLVMLRHGYRVRYEASKFYWNFQFGGRDNDVLYCKLSEMKEGKLKGLVEGYEAKVKRGTPRELKGNIWEDVTVKIGVIQGHGKKFDQADFLKWIKVSLDLDRPSKVITTSHGCLILDDQFKGRIYLKGLYLEGEPAVPFKFCYNFYRGEVNRDRYRLSNPKEEASTLAKIWAEAVKLDEESVLPRLVEMLQADKQWADVSLAEDYISEETATKVWKCLQDENVDGKRFYYYDQNGNKDIELIVKSLQKEPTPLKKATWLSLRKFQLIHTPEEQRHHLLQNAPVTDPPNTPYSNDVIRALRSVLALDSRTRKLRLEFRSSAKAELDLLLQGSDLLINGKWLDFNSSHEDSSCSTFLEAKNANIDIDRFSCSHIVKALYDLILVELSKGPDAEQNKCSHSEDYLRQMVSERIDQMPCMVHLVLGDVGGVLIVEWVHIESEKLSKIHSLDLMGRVTMHRETTCSDMKLKLLTSSSFEPESTLQEVQEDGGSSGNIHRLSECGCPEQLVSLKESRAVFSGLSHEEEYFPMVARTDSQAFFALPPKALRPNAPVPNLPDRLPLTRTLISSVPISKPDENISRHAPLEDGAFDDLYDVSDEENVIGYGRPLGRLQRSSWSALESNSVIGSRPEDSRFESPSSSPRSHDYGLMANDETEYQHTRLPAMDSHIQKLTTEIETQKRSVREKDQRLEELETEVATLCSQLYVERPKTRQLEEKLDTQRELLVAKETELSEVKLHLAAQSEDLEARIAALRADEQYREQSTAEIERLHGLTSMLEDALHANEQQLNKSTSQLNELQTLLQNANNELRCKETQLHAAKSSTSAAGQPPDVRATDAEVERLRSENRELKKQIMELESDLEKTQEGLLQALDIAKSAASRNMKRPRIKEELEEHDDSTRLSDGALKRAKQENVNRNNRASSQNVVEID